MEPDKHLVELLVKLGERANYLIKNEQSNPVLWTDGAGKLMDWFERICDHKINTNKNNAVRQMWNRAALKSKRVAALVAIGRDFGNCEINEDDYRWALTLILKDISIMDSKITGGDIGYDDNARALKLKGLIKEYIDRKVQIGKSYKVSSEMRVDRVISRQYIQYKTAQFSCYYNHKLGHVRAMDAMIDSAIANGYLIEVSKEVLINKYLFYGKAYKIVENSKL
jgi:hypothetical protein